MYCLNFLICLGSLSVIVLPNHILQVSWEPADDAERALINYIVNTTTADMKYNNSTLVKHPITSVSITGLPQYSAGTVSVWAKNSGALSERVISTFRMVNIVTNGIYVVHSCNRSPINTCSSACVAFNKSSLPYIYAFKSEIKLRTHMPKLKWLHYKVE